MMCDTIDPSAACVKSKVRRMRASVCTRCGALPPRTASDGTRMLLCEPCAAQSEAERYARYVGLDPVDAGLRARHKAMGRCGLTMDIEYVIGREEDDR